MDLKSIVEVAAGLAGVVSTSLEIQRRVSDYQSGSRAQDLRVRAEELAKFLQIQTQLHKDCADEQLTQEAISCTKKELDEVLQELVRLRQGAGATKVDRMSPIRRWLLLFVPTRRPAWVLHFGFYFCVWFVVLGVSKFEGAPVLTVGPVNLFVLGLITFTIVAVLLRYWAVMEKRWSEGLQSAPSPICQRLLWYRPSSRRELIARAGVLFGFCQFCASILAVRLSPLKESLTFVQLSVTLIAFYAWNSAELSLATHPVEKKFPRNLRFLRWPQNWMTWFWTICFYFMAVSTIVVIKQDATISIPASYRNVESVHIGLIIGLVFNLLVAYLLPMYALNRILLAQSEQEAH